MSITFRLSNNKMEVVRFDKLALKLGRQIATIQFFTELYSFVKGRGRLMHKMQPYNATRCTTCTFCSTNLLCHSYSRLGWVWEGVFEDCCNSFYRPDSLTVTQPTASVKVLKKQLLKMSLAKQKEF